MLRETLLSCLLFEHFISHFFGSKSRFYNRAWASSGGAIYPSKPRSESEAEFRSFLKEIECEDVECLRNKDVESLFKAVQYPWRKPQPDLPSQQEDPAKQQQWLVSKNQVLNFYLN